MSDGFVKEDRPDHTKYPVTADSHIIQYDEHVFVWFDEAGMAGGACSTRDEAQRQLQQYAWSLGDRIHEMVDSMRRNGEI
jgi:hypothetical protein